MRKTENIINRTGINKTECKKTGHSKENKIPGVKCTPKIELYLSNFKGALHWWNGSLFFLIIILGITLGIFAGCKNIFVPEPPATPEAAGPGGGITVPLRLFTGSARSVMPGMEDITWEITATSDSAEATVFVKYPDFMISFPFEGKWTIEVKGKSGTESGAKEIFTGEKTMEITGSTTSISILLSPGSGMRDGTGTIDLTMTVPTNVTKVMYKLDSDAVTKLDLTDGSCSLNKTDVSAGPHTLFLYFLDGDGTTVYMCTETVNVWNGVTSNQWIKTSGVDHINDSGEFELTKGIIDNFLKTMGSVVYVNASAANTPATGSIFAPVNSVSTAVDILREANPGGKCNGTIMVSEEATIDREIEVKNGETLTVKGMGENASIKNTSGRVFNIASGGSLTLRENITLTGTVTDGNGGAVYVNGGTFTMEAGSAITGGQATYGGGVYVAGGNFIMEGNSIITESSATGTTASSGGAVYVAGGSFTMNGTATIQGNRAATHGGGVHILTGGTFTMNGGTIDGTIGGTAANTAENGGGVFVSGGTFNMNGGTISGNTVTQSGGGVCIYGGTFTMSGGAVISGNTANSSGGGVFVSDGGDFTMNGGTIGETGGGSPNSAENGGGVYIHNGAFTMSGSAVINGNKASGISSSGGGVYVGGDSLDTSTFTMSGGAVISGNSATSSGGGVYVYETGEFTMMGGTIGGTDVATTGNSSESGGGVCVYRGGFTMSDGSISGNIATVSGGGVYVDGTSSIFFMQGNGTITNNNANLGGGVYVGDGTFTVSGSSPVITENAESNVYLANGNTITIGVEDLTGGTIGVTAAEMGQGKFVSITDKTVDRADTIFTSDVEGYTIVESSDTVYLSDVETMYVTTGGKYMGTFVAALAAVNGSSGTITLLKNIDSSNAVFGADSANNQPITFTGGTEVNPIILDLNGKTIDRELNTSTTDGSVIKIEGGTLTIKDSSATNHDGTDGTGKITGGNSLNAGGGINIENNSGSSLTLGSGNISGNSVDSTFGGGVSVGTNCTFTMTGGKIDSNESGSSGGGVGVNADGTFTMTGGIIENNTADMTGGGVNIGNYGTFTMKGGTISDNDASMTGGGVNLGASGAKMTLEDGTISGNTATMNGGGVGVSTGNFTMTGGTLSGNTATSGNGGGVYVDGVNSNFIMTGGTISGNTATQKGGGVYVGTDNFTLGSSIATASSPVISGNKETDTSPNNVYLYNGKTLSITGELKKSKEPGNIGISMATPGVFTSDWSKSGLPDSTFFFSDDTKRNVALSGSELSLNLVRVEGGSCTLNGQNVTLSSFWISPYEVTQAEFASIMTGNANDIEPNPSEFQGDTKPPAEGDVQGRRPVEKVSWYDAIVYCNLLSMKEGLIPCYTIKSSTDPAAWGTSPTSDSAEDYADWKSVTCDFNANGYRLPTEAEWEYAARGGQPGITDGSWEYWYSGSNTANDVAWYSDNSDHKTHEVGKKQANSLGLYDMSGNVWEWCWDWHGSYPSDTEDPAGPDTGDSRVLRGGSWNGNDSNCTASSQSYFSPCGQSSGCGFRLVRSAR